MKRFVAHIFISIAFISLFECTHKPIVSEKPGNPIHIIPQPANLSPGDGVFKLSPGMTIVVNTENSEVAVTAGYLSETLIGHPKSFEIGKILI